MDILERVHLFLRTRRPDPRVVELTPDQAVAAALEAIQRRLALLDVHAGEQH
jgi:hypothetical protein